MGSLTCYTPCSSKFSYSPTINSLESTLLLGLSNVKDLVLEFEQLCISSEKYKAQYLELKDKCESNKCKGSEALKEVIAAKDKVIQLTASALTKLDETKDFKIINDIFKILCGDTSPPTPTETKPTPIQAQQHITTPKMEIKKEPESPVYSPEKDLITELNAKEDSLLEIEGTPTGRTSPIIQPKKFRSSNNSTAFREKKKCPGNWHSSENKAIKLLYPLTPIKKNQGKEGGRLKQSKLNLVKLKQSNSIDLTSSPEFSGGVRVPRSESLANVQPLIKKESIESEDTILPSPTSGPTNFSTLYKSASKNSPIKFKAPLSLSRSKKENMPKEEKCESPVISDATNIEESINILQPNRKNGFKRQPPVKSLIDNDITDCETQIDDSISLLQHVKILEANQENVDRKTPPASPSKRPLVENKNITNMPEDVHIESSLSLLRREIKVPTEDKVNSPSKKPLMENKNITNMPEDVHIESSLSLLRREIKVPTEDKVKRRIPDPAEDIYKEPTVRKKAEKRALPGWSCDECEGFFAELYKDDPEMLAKKMDECSKHRGRKNPARPKTPEKFWEVRWEVPTNTEELNKMNNAV